MNIIGITGTLGAGKGTIVEYLVQRHGYIHHSVRELLTRKIVARKLPVNRDSMVEVANELRRSHSPSYLVECLYDQAVQSGEDSIIESIRTEGEIRALRGRIGFTLFCVDAPPHLRYERIRRRGSPTDGISFEEFLQHEQREMQSKDPNEQNLLACMRHADFSFSNDSTVESLHLQVESALETISH